VVAGGGEGEGEKQGMHGFAFGPARGDGKTWAGVVPGRGNLISGAALFLGGGDRMSFAAMMFAAAVAAGPATPAPSGPPAAGPSADATLNLDNKAQNAAVAARNQAAEAKFDAEMAEYAARKQAQDAAYAQAMSKYDAALAAQAQAHAADLAAWRAKVVACHAGQFSNCAPPPKKQTATPIGN
jgi:hypothetical protein